MTRRPKRPPLTPRYDRTTDIRLTYADTLLSLSRWRGHHPSRRPDLSDYDQRPDERPRRK